MRKLRVMDGYFCDEDGVPVYLIGANFWPRHTGPWMYRDPWDANAIANDLREVAALGCNVVRIFCFTPDFMPASDVVSAQALDRLSLTVDYAAREGMWSIPTFLVGHMSGENFQTSWSVGRDWYTDPLLLEASELLIGTIAAHFARDSRIAAWLLTNEWPLFAGRTSSERGLAWARRLSATLRAADPEANISLGDGSWDVINGQRNGLPSPELANMIDFYGPHFYPKENSQIRHSMFAGFAMRMLESLPRPVLLEEFGCSSDQADDHYAADYYRTVLWSAFGAGNCGTLFWNSHDFTIADRTPYAHHPYELHFGVIRADGSQKPQAQEVVRFAKFVARHDPLDFESRQPRVAIGRTAYYLTDFPFDWGWTTTELRDLYLQTFTDLSLAGTDATFVDIASAALTQFKLLVVPCLQQVTTSDAAALEAYVRGGGTLYLSFGGEPWFPHLGEFIGARLPIRYGLVEPAPREALTMTLLHDLGNLAEGATLRIPILKADRKSSPLLSAATDARVIASDDDGGPALLHRRLGRGQLFFSTYPIEYYAHQHGNHEVDVVCKLYAAIAQEADARASVRTDHSFVQTYGWTSKKSGVRRILLVNHAWERLEVELLGISGGLVDAESGKRHASHRLELGPKAVRIFDTVARTAS